MICQPNTVQILLAVWIPPSLTKRSCFSGGFLCFCQFPMNLNSFAVINHKISQAHLAHFQFRTWNPSCLLGTFVPFNGKWNSFPIIWLPACSFCYWFYAFQLLRNETLLGINLRKILRLYKYFQFKWMLTDSIFKDCFFFLRFHYVKYLQISKFKPTQQGALRDNSSDFCPFLLFSTSLFRKLFFLSVWGLSFIVIVGYVRQDTFVLLFLY